MSKRLNLLEDFLQGKIDRRKFIQRSVALGVSAAGIEAVLAACGGGSSSGSTTTLSFANWASAETATKAEIDAAIKGFETANHAKINNVPIPFDSYLDQVQTMAQGGNTPDVIELSGNWPYSLGAGGALNSYIPQSWRNDAFPNSFEVGTYKGQVYAVPLSITPHGFWYSKDLMQQAGLDPTKPPKTMDELNSMMEELRAKLPADVYPIGLDTSKTEYALVGFWPWIWTFGGNPMIEDPHTGQVTVNWADEGTVKAFQWLQDCVKKKWSPADQAIKAERDLISNGKLVFKLDGPYLPGTMKVDKPNDLGNMQQVNQHFGVTTTPLGPGQTQPVTAADIHNIGMSATSQNKDLAWKLIDYMTSNHDVIVNFLIPEGGVLPHKSMVTSGGAYAKYYSDPINQTFINEIIPTMRPPAYGPQYDQAANFIVTALQQIAGGAPVVPTLQSLTNQVKTVYASS